MILTLVPFNLPLYIQGAYHVKVVSALIFLFSIIIENQKRMAVVELVGRRAVTSGEEKFGFGKGKNVTVSGLVEKSQKHPLFGK